MDQETMTIKCFRCQRQQLLLSMVMDASGKGMVCRSCAGLSPGKNTPRVAPVKAEKTLSSGKYQCGTCKYRFASSKSAEQMICPYCGGRNLTTPAENSADALLRDAGRKDYDF